MIATPSLFQFTHPGGVRQHLRVATQLGEVFQFTHPGGVRPRQPRPVKVDSLVSIHAPGRGATFGATFFDTDSQSFNSRTREGCDGGVN